MKKGQISLEVMYSVGIMIIIFIILSGISFERKITLDRLDRFLERKNECYRIANVIDGVHANGHETIAQFTVFNPVTIQTNGVIIVRESDAGEETTRSIEAFCSYHASVSKEKTVLAKDAPITILVQNLNGEISIT